MASHHDKGVDPKKSTRLVNDTHVKLYLYYVSSNENPSFRKTLHPRPSCDYNATVDVSTETGVKIVNDGEELRDGHVFIEEFDSNITYRLLSLWDEKCPVISLDPYQLIENREITITISEDGNFKPKFTPREIDQSLSSLQSKELREGNIRRTKTAHLTLSSQEVLPSSGHETNVPTEKVRQEISNGDDFLAKTYEKPSTTLRLLGITPGFQRRMNPSIRFYNPAESIRKFTRHLRFIAKEGIRRDSQESYWKIMAKNLLPPTRLPQHVCNFGLGPELPDLNVCLDLLFDEDFDGEKNDSGEHLVQGGHQGDLSDPEVCREKLEKFGKILDIFKDQKCFDDTMNQFLQGGLSNQKMKSRHKGIILATCHEQLERIGETLGIVRDPVIFNGTVNQFLQGDCKPNDDEIILLGRLKLEPNPLIEFIFANEVNMARIVGVGIPNTIVTLKRGAMKANVTKYDENIEREGFNDMDDHGFQIVTLNLPSVQNMFNNDIGKLAAKEMAKEYGVGFHITSSGVPMSTITRHGDEEFDYVYRLDELAKLWLWSNLQELVLKKEVFDMENSIHKLIFFNPKVTIWGLWEMIHPLLSTNNVRNDGSNASSSGGGGGGGGGKNNRSEDQWGKHNHDEGNNMGGGGGGGGPGGGGAPTSDGEEEWIVEVHPGYGCLKNSDYAKHIQSITIEPTLTFHFKKGIKGAHEIHTKLFVNYGMGFDTGPNDFKDNHFAWYQNSLGISLQCMSQDAARIKHASVNILGVEDVKTNHTKAIITSTNPDSTTIGGGLTLKALSIAEGNIQLSKTSSPMPTTSSQDVRTRELRGTQLSNGFVPVLTSDGGPQPHLSCKFGHREIVPHEVLHNEECWRECASWSTCGSLKGSIEGTWQGLNKDEACPYKFRAERCLKGLFWSDCEPMIRSKSVFKRKKVQEQQLEEKMLHQAFSIQLFVNHAMTHIHKLRKFSCMERGETCDGVLSIERIDGAPSCSSRGAP